MFLPAIEGALRVAACAVLAEVVVCDLTERRIPNLCAGLLLGGGLLQGALHGWSGVWFAAFGAITGLALLAWPYARGFMGAGDVKLLAGIGAWVGSSGAVVALLFGSLLGGAFAMLTLAQLGAQERRKVGQNLLGVALMRGLELPEPSRLSRERGIPFGVPLSIVAAAMLVLRSLS